MIFIMYILERQLSLRWREVFDMYSEGYETLEQFEASPYHTKHLPPSKLKPQSANDVCPSADKWDVGCPCAEKSAARNTGAAKSGLVLVIVPAKVVGNWLREWTKMIDTNDSMLKLRCYYAHAGKIYNNVNATPLNADNAEHLRCNKHGRAKPEQERILLLTTKGSYNTHVLKVLQHPESNFTHNFRVGQIFIDEFHETKTVGGECPKLVLGIKKEISDRVVAKIPEDNDPEWNAKDERRMAMYRSSLPWVWGFSATPWTRDLTDCSAMIYMIEQPWWYAIKGYQHLVYEEVEAVGKLTASYRKRKNPVDKSENEKNVADMKRILNSIEIKRTPLTTDINGTTELVKLPPHETRHIACLLNPKQKVVLRAEDQRIQDEAKAEYAKECAAARKAGKEIPAPTTNSYFNRAHKLRAATVIPSLLEYARRHNLSLTQEELKGGDSCNGGQGRTEFPELAGLTQNWEQMPLHSIYAKHIDELTADAPKLVRLKELIGLLGEDIYGRPEKLVIFTSSPVIACILAVVSPYLFHCSALASH